MKQKKLNRLEALVQNSVEYQELKGKLDRLSARFEWYIIAAIFGGWALCLFLQWMGT